MGLHIVVITPQVQKLKLINIGPPNLFKILMVAIRENLSPKKYMLLSFHPQWGGGKREFLFFRDNSINHQHRTVKYGQQV